MGAEVACEVVSGKANKDSRVNSVASREDSSTCVREVHEGVWVCFMRFRNGKAPAAICVQGRGRVRIIGGIAVTRRGEAPGHFCAGALVCWLRGQDLNL
jgi:hypothetical protein